MMNMLFQLYILRFIRYHCGFCLTQKRIYILLVYSRFYDTGKITGIAVPLSRDKEVSLKLITVHKR